MLFGVEAVVDYVESLSLGIFVVKSPTEYFTLGAAAVIIADYARMLFECCLFCLVPKSLRLSAKAVADYFRMLSLGVVVAFCQLCSKWIMI